MAPEAGQPALRADDDRRRTARMVGKAHEAFIRGATHVARAVRPVVVDSWARSLSAGLDPSLPGAPVALAGEDLTQARNSSPLAHVMPLVRTLLVDTATQTGSLVAVGDDLGRLLWVEGSKQLRSRAESMGFAPGGQWSEDAVGTNAPGTALALDRPVQIYSAEHFSGVVQRWSCAAAPVHDPHTGEVLGVIDLTGGDDVAEPHVLALVRATVAACEATMRSLPKPEPAADQWQLDVLGRDRGALHRGHHTTTLSSRHTEMLLLLACHPEGLTAEQLAVMLSDDDIPVVTIRAELVRLRRVIGHSAIMSRPYRLACDLRTDLHAVLDALARGAVRQALTLARGPLLPSSDAPAIAALRDEVHARLRFAAMSSRDPHTVMSYTDSPDGREDVDALELASRLLPQGSPRRTALQARIAHLNDLYGL